DGIRDLIVTGVQTCALPILVLNPDRFDVIVASNLFGDIISDLGPATAGTIGIAASGNINPERSAPSIFEPVHGSAPDIAGKKIRSEERRVGKECRTRGVSSM